MAKRTNLQASEPEEFLLDGLKVRRYEQMPMMLREPMVSFDAEEVKVKGELFKNINGDSVAVFLDDGTGYVISCYDLCRLLVDHVLELRERNKPKPSKAAKKKR